MCTRRAMMFTWEFLKQRLASATADKISASNISVEPADVRTASGYTMTKSIRLPSPFCHVLLDWALIRLGSLRRFGLTTHPPQFFPTLVFFCQTKSLNFPR